MFTWHFRAFTFSVRRTEHWKRSMLDGVFAVEVDATGCGETGMVSSGSEGRSACILQSQVHTLGMDRKE